MKSIFQNRVVIFICLILVSFCLSGCSQSLEEELQDINISNLIKVDSYETFGKVLSRYNYAKNISFRYENTDMSEYLYVTIVLDLEKKEYAPIIKTSPSNVKAGVILKFAKTRTTQVRYITPFPGSQILLILKGKEFTNNMDDYLFQKTLQQLYNNEPITAPFKTLYIQ
ncbi:hypothetical protein [Desulfovibrio litoralis]|uniref:Uncharacterized protein n=1 Tax=Desulfovibrio litoralis DSM 11393 TaxID=1121455 RepID=A0A1M7TPE2_9BACT|nr:hypothetical protein [Desulfovibrio litoralis]SHN72609.1 hypothetical protein SAMN02745728_02328 [Desulfovibrio litoralis DSM 11393]